MRNEDGNRDELLLDWHLNQLDDTQRAWIQNELDRDTSFRQASDRLGRLLKPLDYWQVSPAPQRLVEKTLAYVRGTHQPQAASMTHAREPAVIRGPFPRMRDLIAAAACILLLIGVMLPGLSSVRSRAQQALCAQNLGSIFQGVSAYQQDFNSALPYAGTMSAASWLPSPDRPFASNSRHLFRLVKHGYGPRLANFICPSDDSARPMAADRLALRDDFDSPHNVSYDSLNLAGAQPNVRPRVPLVYLSDPNPLFVGAQFHESVDPDTTNSPAHRGRGQNALVTDGHAEFVTTPFFGNRHDNMWLAGNIRHYTGTETRASDEDVHLVPGYPTPSPRATTSPSHE